MQQDKPRFGPLIGQAGRRWRQVIDQRLQNVAVTEAGLAPLVALSRAGKPMRQKDLAAALSLDTSSLVRILTRLESNGLVASSADPEDGRAKALTVTAEGEVLAQQALTISRSVESHLLEGLDDERVEIAREVLQHLLLRLEAL